MFFPYDSSSPDLNCSKFGLLTILSATIIGTNHTSFLLGRGDSFLSSLGSNNSNYLLIGRNYTYLNYLLSFPSAKLVLITTDFQELVSKPENVYFTNRPSNYSLDQFGSVYVANHTLALLTYLSLFSDIYIAAFVPRTTDIVCGYNPVPLVAASSPKNTLSIGTANTKDWTDFATNSFPLVSSTPVPSSNVPGSSLLASSTQQSLIFSLKAAYSEVTSFSSSAGTAITNNWGFLIMTNPKLTFGSSFTLAETILSGLTASANTVLNSSAVNQYSLIKLQGSTSNNLQTYFQVVSSKQSIGFYPVTLNSFSSIY